MCCNKTWCYTDMSHCEWAVCGYEGFLVLVSLLYVGTVWLQPRVCTLIWLQTELYLHTTMKPTPKNPHTHTQPTHSETYLCNITYCYSTYQHEAITSRGRQLLMMGTRLPETCGATIKRETKNTKSDIELVQPRHIPTRGYNITQSSAPDDGHMVARNMSSNY